MDEGTKPLMVIRQAGNYPTGNLVVEGIGHCCGKVCQGIGVHLVGGRGGWVMDRRDILKLAAIIRQYKPRNCHHGPAHIRARAREVADGKL